MNDRRWVIAGVSIAGVILVLTIVLYVVFVELQPPGAKGRFPFPFARPTPTTGQQKQTVPPTSITKLTLSNGSVLYKITGKFVTAPSYQRDLLRGEFVIDQDPTNQRIPVLMTERNGVITVGRTKSSDFEMAAWKQEPTETLKNAIVINKTVQLRIQIIPGQPLGYPKTETYLDQLMKGSWNLPPNFLFVPTMVGVTQ